VDKHAATIRLPGHFGRQPLFYRENAASRRF
jgi:hypothetical protein